MSHSTLPWSYSILPSCDFSNCCKLSFLSHHIMFLFLTITIPPPSNLT